MEAMQRSQQVEGEVLGGGRGVKDSCKASCIKYSFCLE